MNMTNAERPFAPSPAPSVVITVPGRPVPKGRPRFGSGHAYTPKATRNFETQLKWLARLAMQHREIFLGPVKIEVLALFPIPQSWPTKKKTDALNGLVRPTGKPDLDNLLKTVDALNGVVWKDDSQVVSALVRKRYWNEPSLKIEVEAMI